PRAGWARLRRALILSRTRSQRPPEGRAPKKLWHRLPAPHRSQCLELLAHLPRHVALAAPKERDEHDRHQDSPQPPPTRRVCLCPPIVDASSPPSSGESATPI